MLNKIVLQGRLTRDPELRYTTTQKPVTSWTLAVERDFKGGENEKISDFVNCVGWNSCAEFVSRNFRKGQMMALEGRLQSRKWVDRDGNNHVEWEVNAEHVYFCGDKKKDEQPNYYERQNFEELDEDEEVPF